MTNFCVKKLNVDFRKISDDLYSIIDLSEYDYNKFDDLFIGINEIKIKTPRNEEFTVYVQSGGSQIFSVKERGILPMTDGQYCISTNSCGAEIKKLVGYYPELKEKIDGLVMTTKDKKYIHVIYTEYQLMTILDEHDDKKSAERIYQDISDMLEKCWKGERCF